MGLAPSGAEALPGDAVATDADGGLQLSAQAARVLEERFESEVQGLREIASRKDDELATAYAELETARQELADWWSDFKYREAVKADHSKRGPGGSLQHLAKVVRFCNDADFGQASSFCKSLLDQSMTAHGPLSKVWEPTSTRACFYACH